MTIHRVTHRHPDLDVEHDELVATHCCKAAAAVRIAVRARQAAEQSAFDMAADRLHAGMGIVQ